MVNVASNVKLATSGTTPTTANLPKGYMAFGNFGGKNKLYGNVGSEVADLIGNAKTVLYFKNQSELDEFLQGSDVPVGEWYAAVAEKIYKQYGEWATFNFTGVAASSPYSAPITFNSGSANASDYFALSDTGYQIVARNDVSTPIEVSLNATAFKAAQIGNVPINVIFENGAWNGGIQTLAPASPYVWTVTGVWSSAAKAVIWDDSMVYDEWIKKPTYDVQRGYLYINIMPAESSLDVIGTITLRQIIDGGNNG